MKLSQGLTSRREAFTATLATLATLCLTVVEKKKEVRHQRVQWARLALNEPFCPGDFFASEDPNLARMQGIEMDSGHGYHDHFNLQMQAVNCSRWGKFPPDERYWRPVGMVDV